MIALLVGVLFGCAGRWDLPFYWAYVGVLVGMMMAGLAVIDRGLLQERIQPGAGGLDRHLRMRVMPFFVLHLIIAPLDVGRFHWTTSLCAVGQSLGLVGLSFSMLLSIWAIHTNRFFSPVVRIQEERGHHLVTDGPYGLVRHPGYLAALGMMISSGVALGSWPSMIPLAVPVALILRRVVIEDRFLHENLEGYRDYAQTVRFRLFPKVW